MRYTEIDLQSEDILWFAIDTNGSVLAFTSGGSGNVPEFVCRSKEETEFLESFFDSYDAANTTGILLIENDGSPLSEDALRYACHGITCFDVDINNNNSSYTKISFPEKPLCISELPKDVRKVLSDHTINVDASATNTIDVPHAFSL